MSYSSQHLNNKSKGFGGKTVIPKNLIKLDARDFRFFEKNPDKSYYIRLYAKGEPKPQGFKKYDYVMVMHFPGISENLIRVAVRTPEWTPQDLLLPFRKLPEDVDVNLSGTPVNVKDFIAELENIEY